MRWLVAVLTSGCAHNSGAFQELSATGGVVSHVSNGEGDVTARAEPAVGFRYTFGIQAGTDERARYRIGPSIDAYHVGSAGESSEAVLLGVATRVDWPVNQRWRLGPRVAIGMGDDFGAAQPGFYGTVGMAGLHARDRYFLAGVDIVAATNDGSRAASVLASVGVTGKPAGWVAAISGGALVVVGIAMALTLGQATTH